MGSLEFDWNVPQSSNLTLPAKATATKERAMMSLAYIVFFVVVMFEDANVMVS